MEACLYWILPATVPNGRLAICQATVRRNWRVLKCQGRASEPRGIAGASGAPYPAIEMIAELVERAHNLAGKMILGRRASP